MNILCYGASPERQKEQCEFFQGAGCCAEWATDFDSALTLLSTKPFDSVIFGHNVPASECDRLVKVMHSIRPKLMFFSLADTENGTFDETNAAPFNNDHLWSNLVSVYLRLNARG